MGEKARAYKQCGQLDYYISNMRTNSITPFLAIGSKSGIYLYTKYFKLSMILRLHSSNISGLVSIGMPTKHQRIGESSPLQLIKSAPPQILVSISEDQGTLSMERARWGGEEGTLSHFSHANLCIWWIDRNRGVGGHSTENKGNTLNTLSIPRIYPIRAHSGPCLSVVYIGEYTIATSGYDEKIRFWCVLLGECKRILPSQCMMTLLHSIHPKLMVVFKCNLPIYDHNMQILVYKQGSAQFLMRVKGVGSKLRCVFELEAHLLGVVGGNDMDSTSLLTIFSLDPEHYTHSPGSISNIISQTLIPSHVVAGCYIDANIAALGTAEGGIQLWQIMPSGTKYKGKGKMCGGSTRGSTRGNRNMNTRGRQKVEKGPKKGKEIWFDGVRGQRVLGMGRLPGGEMLVVSFMNGVVGVCHLINRELYCLEGGNFIASKVFALFEGG